MYAWQGFWAFSFVLYQEKKVASRKVNMFPTRDERRLRTPVFAKHFGFHLSIVITSMFIFIHLSSVICILGLLEVTGSRDMVSSHPKIKKILFAPVM
jgi:hypothetical protein